MSQWDKLFVPLAKALLSTLCSSGFETMLVKNKCRRIGLAEGSKGGLFVLLGLSAVLVLTVSRISAADFTDHPHFETKDLKPETSLKRAIGGLQNVPVLQGPYLGGRL